MLGNVSIAGFSGKPILFDSDSIHHEMLGETNFERVFGVCVANAMIFIKKYFVN